MLPLRSKQSHTFIPFHKGTGLSKCLERGLDYIFGVFIMPSIELQARVREQKQAAKEQLVKCVYRGVAYNRKSV